FREPDRNTTTTKFPRGQRSLRPSLIADSAPTCADTPLVEVEDSTHPGSSADVHQARSIRRRRAARVAATELLVRPAFELSARGFADPSWDLLRALARV